MSISSTNRKAGPYAGNDVTVAFPFAFKVFSSADVLVIGTDLSGVETTKVLGTDYSIALNSDQNAKPGGAVNMLAAPASGFLLTITSDIDNLQPTLLTNAGGFYPKVINDSLDRATIQIQQLAEQVSRSVKVQISSSTPPDELIDSLIASESNAAASASAAATAEAAAIGYADDASAAADSAVASAAAAAAATVFTQAGTGAVGRSYESKMRDFVNVTEFMSSADRVANDLAPGSVDLRYAFAAAIAALPGGGGIRVGRGRHRIVGSPLPLHSGLSFYGEGCTNDVFGVPTYAERPSYIFIDSDVGILFNHAAGVQMESLGFYDISFGARINPTTVARGTATGFNFSGSYPADIKHITFERCQFSNFGGYGIRVRDPLAPHGDPDWNVCPVVMTDCTFYYNTIGVELAADNADMWTLTNCAFFGTTYGINCVRSGTLLLINCFGGGAGTTMLITSGTIRDNITMIGCQYENATAMLHVADTMPTQNTYRPIKMIDCTVEAPVILASNCHLIIDGGRWVDNLEVTATGAVIDAFGTACLPTTAWNIAAGSSVRNFTNHGADLPLGVRGQIVDGKCVRNGTAPPVSGTFLIGDITHNSAPAAGSPEGWMCAATGTPGTWLPYGQVGYRSNAGTPVGTLTPKFVGEEILNTSTGAWWKSVGGSSSSWVALN